MVEPTEHRATTPRDRQVLPGAFGLVEAARRIGHYRWIEMRLFEVLGGWAATVPELDVKLALGAHAPHHAWHAQLWLERLPEVAGMDPQDLTAPPNEELVAFVDALGAPADPDATLEKLVGVYRVLLPHLVAVYTFHLDHAGAVADAPTIRSLDFVLRDDLTDWRQGELLLQSLLSGPEEVDRAASHLAHLEKLLVAAGGVAGPGTLRAGPA